MHFIPVGLAWRIIMKWLIHITLMWSCGLWSQQPSHLRFEPLDSLYSKAKHYWLTYSDSVYNYADGLSQAAHQSKRTTNLLKAYHIKGLVSEGSESQQYADSILTLANAISSDKFKAIGYFLKGRNYYATMDYKESLDYFLKTSELLETKVDSTRLKYLVKDNIGVIRLMIGDNQKAIALFSELLDYYAAREGWNSYLMTKFSLAVAYHQDRQFEKSQEVALEGLDLARELGSEEYFYLLSVYGANLYAEGHFSEAIDSLKVANKYFIEAADYPNQSIANYFLGQSHAKLGNQDAALRNLHKVDSMFRVDLKNVYPLTRPTWEVLIDDAKAKNDQEKELYYITSLLKVDSVISSNYKYANRNLTIKYDMQGLLRERDQIVQSYRNKNLTYVVASVAIFLLASIVFIFYRRSEGRKIRKYRKTIEDFENNNQKRPKLNSKPKISEETLNQISDGLAELEESKFFLDSKANLTNVAKKLETNNKYLSMYINHYEGKSFSNYLNDLRVDFLIERLRQDPKFKNRYTLDAIAKESGFASNEHLSRAFKKKTNLKPSDYLNFLDQERERNS